MHRARPLLEQLRRKQFLLCIYRPDAEAPSPRTIPHVSEILALDAVACAQLMQRLERRGLVEAAPGEAGELRLTARGERLVERMARPRAEPSERSVRG